MKRGVLDKQGKKLPFFGGHFAAFGGLDGFGFDILGGVFQKGGVTARAAKVVGFAFVDGFAGRFGNVVYLFAGDRADERYFLGGRGFGRRACENGRGQHERGQRRR